MISIGLDETLFIQLFLLIVVIAMAKFLYLNPVKATIESRDEKIRQLKSTADSGLASVEDSKKAYEEKLLAVRAEMSAYLNKNAFFTCSPFYATLPEMVLYIISLISLTSFCKACLALS